MNRILKHFDLARDQEPLADVTDNINTAVVFRGTNLWILVFATFIASLGLNVNSTAVVIGAMLISPLMGPIIGFGFGIAINDASLLKKAAANFGFAIAASLGTSTLYFLITPLSDASSEMLARTSPNIYDVLIALFGGAAGFLAVSSKQKGNVIPGVAIATALMPPLCTAGYGLATLNMTFLGGAAYLFLINTVFIALSTLVMAKILRFRAKPNAGRDAFATPILAAIVIATALPSVYFGYDLVVQNRFRKQAKVFVDREAVFPNDFLLKRSIDPEKREITLVFGGDPITQEAIDKVISKLPEYGLADTKLQILQGFAYVQDTKDIDNAREEQQRLAAVIATQGGRIKELDAKIAETNEIAEAKKIAETKMEDDDLSRQVLAEIKVQYPRVQSCAVGAMTEQGETEAKNLWVAIITSERQLRSADRQKIENWLKIRLKADTVAVQYKVA